MSVHVCAKCGGPRFERPRARATAWYCPTCRNETRAAGIIDSSIPDPAIGARDRLRGFLRKVSTEQLVERMRTFGERL